MENVLIKELSCRLPAGIMTAFLMGWEITEIVGENSCGFCAKVCVRETSAQWQIDFLWESPHYWLEHCCGIICRHCHLKLANHHPHCGTQIQSCSGEPDSLYSFPQYDSQSLTTYNLAPKVSQRLETISQTQFIKHEVTTRVLFPASGPRQDLTH